MQNIENAIAAFANLLRTEAENDKLKFADLPTYFKNFTKLTFLK
jgi:hypothetical protein